MTGNVLQDDVDDFLSQGADRVFAKPLRTEEIDFIVRGIGTVMY